MGGGGGEAGRTAGLEMMEQTNNKDKDHAVQNWSGWRASVDPCGSISTPEGDGYSVVVSSVAYTVCACFVCVCGFKREGCRYPSSPGKVLGSPVLQGSRLPGSPAARLPSSGRF